jgi:hypothetical protein
MESMKGKNETQMPTGSCHLDGRNCDITRHPSECSLQPTEGELLPTDYNLAVIDGTVHLIHRDYYNHVRAAYDLILYCGFIDNDLDAALKHLGTILNGEPYDSSTADKPANEHPGDRPSPHRDGDTDQAEYSPLGAILRYLDGTHRP